VFQIRIEANTDPDPAFKVNTDPDPSSDPGFNDKNVKKKF